MMALLYSADPQSALQPSFVASASHSVCQLPFLLLWRGAEEDVEVEVSTYCSLQEKVGKVGIER